LDALARAEYVHLACHNRFSAEDPMRSGLLLSDGELTAAELAAAPLRARLVVLSACQTGVTVAHPGDELMGLVRALLYAGAPAVIVSLWNVFDRSAAELMKLFYQRLLQGAGPGVALAEAQRAMIRDGATMEQWAPFVLVGRWN
jgi:CHAT domain-containing protein